MSKEHSFSVRRMRASAESILLCMVLAVYACILPVYASDLRAKETAAVSAHVTIEYEARDRDQLRQDAVNSLTALAHDETATEAQRKQALTALEKRLTWAEQEAAAEEEIKALGLGPCVVQIATAFASVIVPNQVSAGAAAAIYEAVERASGLSGGDIRIIPLNVP